MSDDMHENIRAGAEYMRQRYGSNPPTTLRDHEGYGRPTVIDVGRDGIDDEQEAHRIKWYVWGWDSQGSYKIRHNSKMRGAWGWDAECSCGWQSCGWQSRTGGATRRWVEDRVWRHKYENGLIALGLVALWNGEK